MKLRLFLFVLAALFTVGLFAQTPCLDFGGQGYVVVPNATGLNPTNVTLEAWLYLDSVTSRPHIIGKGAAISGAYWLVIETTAKPRFFFTVGNSGSWQWVEGSGTVPLNTWFHIAGTYDGSSAKIYINTVLVGTKVASPAGNLRTNDTNPVYIARSYQPITATPNHYVSGMIDEVRIWNDARTAQEIYDNYDIQLSGDQPGLAAYWQMNEDGGTTIGDSYGNYDGTLMGQASWADGPTTLPVELSSFTAIINAQYFVELHWTTQSETATLGYMIYRSEDNKLEHSYLASPLINATNTASQVNYTYTDNEVTPGTWYYWLQAINLDGTSQYHGPVVANVYNYPGGVAPEIPLFTGIDKLYPNPFNPNVSIQYSLKEASPVSFKIFNTRGQLVKSFSYDNRDAGNHELIWNANELPSGVYLIRMQAGDTISNSKAVLSK